MGDFPLFPQGKDPAAPYVPSSPEKKTHIVMLITHTQFMEQLHVFTWLSSYISQTCYIMVCKLECMHENICLQCVYKYERSG